MIKPFSSFRLRPKGFLYFQPPIPASDLLKVHQMLMRADLFVPSFEAVGLDTYSVLTYKQQEHDFGFEFRLLVDRNLVTRWVGLLHGDMATQQHRLAAAVIVFAQCANFLIEPNIALHEFASSAGNIPANHELNVFRLADNLHPQYWTEIALGRTDRLHVPPSDMPVLTPRSEQNLNRTLDRWRRNYVFVLKLAEMHLRGGSSQRSMAEILRWMYEEFFLGGPAVRLAIQYLAPGAGRSGLLKGIESPDREKAIAGLRNASWDLTLLSHFLRKVEDQQTRDHQSNLWILCSLDRHVLAFARSLLGDHGSVDPTQSNHLSYTLRKLWGPDTGATLSQILQGYREDAENSTRQLHRDVPPNFIDDLITRGEATIRDWKPRRR